MNISTHRVTGRRNQKARATLRLALIAAFFAWGVTAPGEPLSDAVLQQITALRAEKAARTAPQLKMDSQLVYAIKQSRKEVIAPGVQLRVAVAPDARGMVTVDLSANVSPEFLDAITQAGGNVLFSSEPLASVRAEVPLAKLELLAARADVRFIRPAYPPDRDTGSVTSEGDVTHTAGFARSTFGVDGSGVTVGVLSDSVDFLAASQATGDSPPNVVVLAGQSGVPGSGEGTAMIEIIHDLAPGASIYFATAGGGEASFAQNILNLRSAGCDIIVDDVRYATESPFQDGIIARAVNTVTRDGALYFASAGNSGNKAHGTSGTWEGDFADGGAAGAPVNGKNGNVHLFGSNTWDTITSPGFSVSLFWADPLGASTNDYDLYILDTNGNNVVSSSTTVQSGTQDPFEIVPMPGLGERVVVVKASGDNRFLHVDSGRGELELNTAGFARGHSAATNAYATAAVYIGTSYPNAFVGGAQNPVEDFSSDGPRRVFFQENGAAITPGDYSSTGGAVRQYPTIAAADGVVTTVPGFAPFFGTSAAAPHAAAIAALLKSYNTELTPAQIRSILTTSALDNEAAGLDDTGGYGIVMATRALTAAPPPIPLPKLVVVTNILSGGNGNGTIDFNECNELDIVLTNLGRATATGIRATLSTTTPGVIIAQPLGSFPNIVVGDGATNLGAFRISTAQYFVCGTPIDLTLLVKCDQNTTTNQWRLTTGVSLPQMRFDSYASLPIPDNNPVGVYSPILVSNVDSIISKVTVSLNIRHTYDSDLTIQLISPGARTNTLVRHRGGNGQNFGFACMPDSQRTTFDDAAPTPITAAAAPFLGSFQPERPLAVFAGRSGTNVNGLWYLRVVDDVGGDAGALQCWTLSFASAACIDGGGECPGSDLTVGIIAQPEPVLLDSLLTYTITVTNLGPSSAKDVTVTHILPSGVRYESAISSQGGCSYLGGIVTANLGLLNAGATATVTVTVTTTAAGALTSSATVTSEQPDFVSANNTAIVLSHVQPPTADLSVGLSSNPSAVSIGGSVVYTLSVTNSGPSAAFPVLVTNTYPPGIVLVGETLSQGSIISSTNNILVINFGNIPNNSRATAIISALATSEGNQVATASVLPPLTDPVIANNTASAVTAVGPSADLVLNMSVTPNPVVLYSNLTYRITLTNRGPSAATGSALNFSVPALIVSNYTSSGTISLSNNLANCALGTIQPGAQVSLVFVVMPMVQGPLTGTAAVSAAQPDPDVKNNAATATAQVSSPFVNIVAAGAKLTEESVLPANGAIDAGETVTVSLQLRNAGNVDNTNLVATLLPSPGISPLPPNTPQNYGVLMANSPGKGRLFSFSTSGKPGDTVTAILQVQDGPNLLPNVLFQFTFPTTFTFSATNSIVLRDATSAVPYPSTINVSGLTGVVGRVTASLLNVSHTFPQDIDALLVGPAGQKTILMSGAGAPPLENANLTFDDAAPLPVPDGTEQIFTSVYKPADYTGIDLPRPAPQGPYPAAMSALNGIAPNGTWALYVDDHSEGDTGQIAGGWTLSLTTIAPVNQLADLSLTTSLGQAFPGQVASTLTYQFVITNGGPNNASFVAFTNALPAGVAYVSAKSSQGTISLLGNAVVGNLGPLNAGTAATVNLAIMPGLTATGLLTNSASVGSMETDLNLANNISTMVVPINLPVADLAVTQAFTPASAVVGFNFTNSISVTNRGPDVALGASLTYPLPAGVTVMSATSSFGQVVVTPGKVTCTFGDFPAGIAAKVLLVMKPTAAGTLTNFVSVASSSTEADPSDNSVTENIASANALPLIVADAARLLDEQGGTTNGTVDPGETVQVALSLANQGWADTANLSATLLAADGITPLGQATQLYGKLAMGGAAVSRQFSFAAASDAAGSVKATLQLNDGTLDLGTVSFVFALPALTEADSTTSIVIPDRGAANPYPSVINVTNLDGVVAKVTVTLRGLTHNFPHDLSVLLVNPTSGNCLLMSRAGKAGSAANAVFTFDDLATNMLPSKGSLTDGTYKPSVYEGPVTLRPPAPAAPYGSSLAALNGQSPNGAWLLYVYDDTTGDGGVIANGWSLAITTVQPINAAADLAVTMSASPASLLTGGTLQYSITVSNLGPADASAATLQDTLPVGVTVLSSSASQGKVTGTAAAVYWNIGSLAAGSRATLFLDTSPGSAGLLVNSVTVSADQVDLNPANSSAQVATTVGALEPPRLTGVMTNGYFQLQITAQPGLDYVTEATPTLTAPAWTPISTNTASPTGTIKVVDDSVPNYQSRFYRALRASP